MCFGDLEGNVYLELEPNEKGNAPLASYNGGATLYLEPLHE